MATSIGVPVTAWSRDDAARHLSQWAGEAFPTPDLLIDFDIVREAFEVASQLHPANVGCEHCRRLQVARDILLGVAPALTDGQGRLL